MAIPINQDITKTIFDSVEIGKMMIKKYGKSSVSRMSQDSIFQMPLIMSNSIDTGDNVMTLAKSMERMYASMFIAAFAANPDFNFNEYGNVNEYIKSIHNNTNIPSNLVGMKSIFESNTQVEYHIVGTEIDSCIDSDVSYFPKEVIMECWRSTESDLDMQSLNDISKPYEYTRNALEKTIERLEYQSALEAAKVSDAELSKIRGSSSLYKDSLIDKNANRAFKVLNKDEKTGKDGFDKTIGGGSYLKTENNNANWALMEPTMIQVNLIGHSKDGGQVKYDIVIGIKTMIRVFPADIIVSNLISASRSSNKLFSFLQWTKGEASSAKKFIKMIAGINEKEVKKDAFGETLKGIKKRKGINNITKFTSNKLMPTTTLIIDRIDIENIKAATGVDLSNTREAVKLLSNYYLLGFGFYDSSTEIFSLILDGQGKFNNFKLSGLKANLTTASGKELTRRNSIMGTGSYIR